MKTVLLLFAMAISLLPMSINASCRPIPGAAELWGNPSLRWIWVGETHGTVEAPAAFFLLACDALAHARNVTVALERPTQEQPAIDAFLDGGAIEETKTALLEEPGWRDALDGRSSNAMLDLLVRLRELKTHYPGLQVVAIDGPTYTSSLGSRDQAIGETVSALAKTTENNLVLVYTGSIHAMKRPVSSYKNSAMYLPPEKVISLLVTDQGGEAWMLTDKGCGPQPHGSSDHDRARLFGIYLDSSHASAGFDGVFALGKATTASEPARSDSAASAPCWKSFASGNSDRR